MFNKKMEITIVTRFKNEDNFKIERLADTWKVPTSVVESKGFDNGSVEIKVVINKSHLEKFKKDLNLLTFVGIEATIK